LIQFSINSIAITIINMTKTTNNKIVIQWKY